MHLLAFGQEKDLDLTTAPFEPGSTLKSVSSSQHASSLGYLEKKKEKFLL